RERGDDVLMLAHRVLARLAAVQEVPAPRLTKAAQAALLGYRFPGNVRELENILERALTLCAGDQIDVEDVQLRPAHEEDGGRGAAAVGSGGGGGAAALGHDGAPLGTQLEEIERDAIVKALEQTRYNKTAAAQVLGISFRALRYRI